MLLTVQKIQVNQLTKIIKTKEREKNFDRATRIKGIMGRIKRGDIKPEHPKEAPPKMVNGYHPKFGKKYKYDKLDPISAASMPLLLEQQVLLHLLILLMMI